MTDESRVALPRAVAALAAIVLLLAGAGATYLLMRVPPAVEDHASHAAPPDATAQGRQPTAAPPASPPTTAGIPLPDVVVPLGTDAVARAGIMTTPVTTGTSTTDLRLPGVIAPNAYRQVAVTPLVAGRVLRVSAELGDRVRRGQTMAEIHSPELAEAQMRYVAAQAMLGAHDRELQRTEKLVEIGAASRQELERVHAEHAAQTAAVQSARSQLELFGITVARLDAISSGANVSATIAVPAPLDGVVTERTANSGLNVDAATALFTVVDLSSVWVVADVYERDLPRVRIGSEATVSTAARPEPGLGRVSYIDPQVNTATRTAQIRIEVPNPRGELRLGMYADVTVAGVASTSVLTVPRSALQNVGDRTVVYLIDPGEPGSFIEREVRLGRTSGDRVEVLSGVQPGDHIVTAGSFFVRAERERLGLRRSTGAAGTTRTADPAERTTAVPAMQTARIVVNGQVTTRQEWKRPATWPASAA